ncbi:sequestosome-1-like [Megalobrama amblycephala]|uniref:sequestosome-1-like n=1 Tax=Megalobrama amblycephala TaxID=75352 RepID=UPI0020140C83|nr:sequestosome-1-like [Megalobrama amblycephala]
MSMTVKAHLIGKDGSNEETRCFDMFKGDVTSFKCLKRKVFRVFLCLGDSPFQIYYKDEDGDMVAFSSDDELMKGLALVKDDTFRLFIKRADHDREWNPAKDF